MTLIILYVEGAPHGGRIIGGTETHPHKYPSMAALINRAGYVGCGATILNRHWVMTSARCVVRTSTRDLKVLVGAHDISKEEDGRQSLSIVETLVHDKYQL